jgi:two-component system KDP operon response regulator KdpE
LREVWGNNKKFDTQYLRVYVGQLRRKLEYDPSRPRFLHNEPGIGYRFQTG